MKTCKICKIEKPLSDFHRHVKSKDGFRSACKKCRVVESCDYYKLNKCSISKKEKEYYTSHTDDIKDRVRRYRDNNKEAVLNRKKRWNENNKERLALYKLRYERNRLATDINYKMSRYLRRRLKYILKGQGSKAVEFLGCSIVECRAYLESKFQPGMTWENWSVKGWHIDHIRPLSSFDLTDVDQLKLACHYTNLQPLWAFDNLSKGARFNEKLDKVCKDKDSP